MSRPLISALGEEPATTPPTRALATNVRNAGLASCAAFTWAVVETPGASSVVAVGDGRTAFGVTGSSELTTASAACTTPPWAAAALSAFRTDFAGSWAREFIVADGVGPSTFVVAPLAATGAAADGPSGAAGVTGADVGATGLAAAGARTGAFGGGGGSTMNVRHAKAPPAPRTTTAATSPIRSPRLRGDFDASSAAVDGGISFETWTCGTGAASRGFAEVDGATTGKLGGGVAAPGTTGRPAGADVISGGTTGFGAGAGASMITTGGGGAFGFRSNFAGAEVSSKIAGAGGGVPIGGRITEGGTGAAAATGGIIAGGIVAGGIVAGGIVAAIGGMVTAGIAGGIVASGLGRLCETAASEAAAGAGSADAGDCAGSAALGAAASPRRGFSRIRGAASEAAGGGTSGATVMGRLGGTTAVESGAGVGVCAASGGRRRGFNRSEGVGVGSSLMSAMKRDSGGSAKPKRR